MLRTQFSFTPAKSCVSNRDAPDIRPENPAFFDIRYPAGYQIALPDIRLGRIPDFRPNIRLMFT
jgi:hypothetical protein